MRWRMRVLVCLLSLIAVVPDILSTIIKDIISFHSESDHWCHSPSQRIVHLRPNNGNVCNNKRYDLIWMLLTEDMRGWILICSQYHMNCYHSCLSFSLQIFSYVSLVACLGGTLNCRIWLDWPEEVFLSCDILFKWENFTFVSTCFCFLPTPTNIKMCSQ